MARKDLARLFALNGAVAVSFGLLLHLPGFIAGCGGSELEIGLYAAAFSAGCIAIRPVAGWALDRPKPERVLLVGCVGGFVTTLPLLWIGRVGFGFLALRFAQGLFFGTTTSALLSHIATRAAPTVRATQLARFAISGTVGIAAGAALGDWALSEWALSEWALSEWAPSQTGFPALFSLAAVFSGGALVLSLVPVAAAPVATRASRVLDSRERWTPIGRSLWRLFAAAALLAGPLAATQVFLEPLFRHGQQALSTYYLAASVTTVSVRLACGGWPHRFGYSRAFATCMLSLAAGFTLLGLMSGPAQVLVPALLIGFAQALALPILAHYVTEASRRSGSQGLSLSVLGGIVDGSGVVAGPLGGVLAEAVGLRAMFLLGAALPLVGVGLVPRMKRTASEAL